MRALRGFIAVQLPSVGLGGVRVAFLALSLLFMPNLLQAKGSITASNGTGQVLLNERETHELLKSLAENVIVPRYASLQQRAEALQKQAQIFCDVPGLDALQAVRKAWAAVLLDWQRANSFLFGPAVEEHIDFFIYFQPIRKKIVKRLLNDPDLNADKIAKSGVGGQGLATVEYLLFDRERSDEQILQDFMPSAEQAQEGGAATAPACVYLTEVINTLLGHTQQIHQRWQVEGENYAADFYQVGRASKVFVDAQEALGTLINSMHQSVQSVSNRKLAALVDKKGQTYPYKLESWRSGQSLPNIKANLDGAADLLRGGLLAALRAHRQEALAQKLEQQLAAIEALEWDVDLFAQLREMGKPAELDLLTEAQQVSRDFYHSLRDELAPVLGVQLGFNDNDGD